MSFVPIVTIILPPRARKRARGRGWSSRAIAENSSRRAFSGPPSTIVERIGGHIAHQKSGDAEHAEMPVHRRLRGGAFLAPKPRIGNQAAAGRIGVRQPHPERLHAIGERRRERIAAVDELERRDLAVGQAGGRAGVGRIRIDVVRAALRGPGMPVRRALRDVEDRAARHVVVHDAVDEAVERRRTAA